MKEKESEIDVADSKVSANGFSRFLLIKIGGHKMTINLSETFANAKTNINAVNNGEPQERQNELYGDMINQLFEETKLQAKAEAEKSFWFT